MISSRASPEDGDPTTGRGASGQTASAADRPPSMASSFPDVDEDSAPDALLAFLDRFAAVPAVSRAKLRSRAMLEPEPGTRVLEVGCGLGDDVRALAAVAASVVGVDRSETCVREARRRHAGSSGGVEFLVADALALPFGDDTFDASRADRTLQHVADPRRGLAELVRVTACAGRVVVSESTIHPHAPGGVPEEVQALLHGAGAGSDQEGWFGFMLPLLMRQAGLAEIEVESTVERVSEPDSVLAALPLRSLDGEARAVLATAVSPGGLSLDIRFLDVRGRKPA